MITTMPRALIFHTCSHVFWVKVEPIRTCACDTTNFIFATEFAKTIFVLAFIIIYTSESITINRLLLCAETCCRPIFRHATIITIIVNTTVWIASFSVMAEDHSFWTNT